MAADSGTRCDPHAGPPQGNLTTDATIASLSVRDDRIVVTKDADFIDSYILRHEPKKLLLVATGNIANSELEALIHANLFTIVAAFDTVSIKPWCKDGNSGLTQRHRGTEKTTRVPLFLLCASVSLCEIPSARGYAPGFCRTGMRQRTSLRSIVRGGSFMAKPLVPLRRR